MIIVSVNVRGNLETQSFPSMEKALYWIDRFWELRKAFIVNSYTPNKIQYDWEFSGQIEEIQKPHLPPTGEYAFEFSPEFWL